MGARLQTEGNISYFSILTLYNLSILKNAFLIFIFLHENLQDTHQEQLRQMLLMTSNEYPKHALMVK